jgi:hypothetical protein
MNEEERQRLNWLELKVTELLWLVIIAGSISIGWLTVYLVFKYLIVDAPGWLLFPVFLGAWALAAIILHRQTFKGAPDHIQYLH